jgi:hypothetical protein
MGSVNLDGKEISGDPWTWMGKKFELMFTCLELKFLSSFNNGCNQQNNLWPLDSRACVKFNIPYILESNPHPFYSFRGLKDQMRIKIASGLDSRSRAGFLEK